MLGLVGYVTALKIHIILKITSAGVMEFAQQRLSVTIPTILTMLSTLNRHLMAESTSFNQILENLASYTVPTT